MGIMLASVHPLSAVAPNMTQLNFERNNLDLETSPYLLQHKDNPVHWQPWRADVFAAAKQQNKPVLLSVGYAACHWCHVMAHESFETEPIAALMNELFINIKVDREERPDVDAIYQAALALTGQQGGWPLTMFITPDAEPFWGGTYFPHEAKYGRPGFPDILQRVAHVFHNDKDSIAKNSQSLSEALQKMSAPAPDAEGGPDLHSGVLDEVGRYLLRLVDNEHGGIGGAPKFPQPFVFMALWRFYLRRGEESAKQAVELTLNRICQGGIYDHLGGGFARYSTDAEWLAPHFEKMLYDNAQLIELLTLVWQETKQPLYRERIYETVEWLAAEMIAENGAFTASLDADSEGEEGKFYVWHSHEIDAVLGGEAELFKQAYDVRAGGNWEGKTILNRSAGPAPLSEDEEQRLARSRSLLLEARAKRIRPGWDDKVLADWNGLMISGLVKAAQAFDEPAWLAMAVRAFAAVQADLGQGDRLLHSWRVQRAQHRAMLDDYAALCMAALALNEATGEAAYLVQAQAWVAALDKHFWNDEHGGYYLTADDCDDLITRQWHASDNATPSGNGQMVGVLNRLWLLTGESRTRERLQALIDAFAPQLKRNFFQLMTYLNDVEGHLRPLQLVIVGAREADDTRALMRARHGVCAPDAVLQVVAETDALPRHHPAFGKAQLNGAATAYVCVGATCSLPLSDPGALALALVDAARGGL